MRGEGRDIKEREEGVICEDVGRKGSGEEEAMAELGADPAFDEILSQYVVDMEGEPTVDEGNDEDKADEAAKFFKNLDEEKLQSICLQSEEFGHSEEDLYEKMEETHSVISFEERKLYKCCVDGCWEAFHVRKEFLLHMRTRHSWPAPCSTCKTYIRTPKLLRTHIKIHSGLKPYSCPKCPKKFNQAGTLQNHMRTHKEKAFKCGLCHLRFSEKRNCEDHELVIHRRELRYACDICHERFGYRASFNLHKKTHTN